MSEFTSVRSPQKLVLLTELESRGRRMRILPCHGLTLQRDPLLETPVDDDGFAAGPIDSAPWRCSGSGLAIPYRPARCSCGAGVTAVASGSAAVSAVSRRARSKGPRRTGRICGAKPVEVLTSSASSVIDTERSRGWQRRLRTPNARPVRAGSASANGAGSTSPPTSWASGVVLVAAGTSGNGFASANHPMFVSVVWLAKAERSA